MSSTDDVETRPIAHEETPLLRADSADEDVDPKDDTERRPVRWYVWRVLLALSAVVALALFIGGWINEGGDVDVCPAPAPETLRHPALFLLLTRVPAVRFKGRA